MLPLRLWAFSIYLRLHQVLAVTIIGALWVHLRTNATFSRIYVQSLTGIFGATTVIIFAIAYHRGCFGRRTFWFYEGMRPHGTQVVRIQQPLQQHVSAGQYLTVQLLRRWPWRTSNPHRLTFYQPEGTELENWRDNRTEEKNCKSLPSGAKAEVEIWAHGNTAWLGALNRPATLQYRWLVRGPYGSAIPAPNVPNLVLVASGDRIASLLWLSHKIVKDHGESQTRVTHLRIHWFLEDWSNIPKASSTTETMDILQDQTDDRQIKSAVQQSTPSTNC